MAHFLMIEGWVSDSGNLILPLLEEQGHTYTFATRNPGHYKTENGSGLHRILQNASEIIETDTNDISELIQKVKTLQFDGVITVCDYYFEAARSVADVLELPCPVPENLAEIRQKHLMRKALDRAGIPNAGFRTAETWEEVLKAAGELGYPLIIKPVDLGSGAFVRLARCEEDLQSAFQAQLQFSFNFRGQKRNTVVLLEEQLKGEEVSVEAVADNGKITIIGVTDKSLTGNPYFIETGHMFPAVLGSGEYEIITEYVKKALTATGFRNGVAHTEVKLTEEGPRIVEINPRTPGNYIVELIDRVKGINLLNLFLELALGRKLKLAGRETGIASAAVAFLVPPRGGTIAEVRGTEALQGNPNLIRCSIPRWEGRRIEPPVDNACYLGHILAQDCKGPGARRHAEQAMKQIEIRFQD